MALLSYMAVFFLTLLSVSYLAMQLIPERHQLQALRHSAEGLVGSGEKPVIFRFFQLPVTFLVPLLAGKGPEVYRERKAEHLKRAGLDQALTVDEIITMKFLLAVVLFVILALYSMPFVFRLFAAIFGFVFPDIWLYDRAKARHVSIIRQMPFALDLLVLLVEAGLDFTAALTQAADKLPEGPLKEELERMLKDFRLGASRVEALRALANRVNLKEMTTLCTALIQATELGTSIGKTLRQQSEIMRTYRFQEAERQGGAASQKMLIPMVVFILPAVFIIIFGPALIRYLYGLF